MTYNKSEIMRRGNELRKKGYSPSDALRMAWAEAKAANSTKPATKTVSVAAAFVSHASIITATVVPPVHKEETATNDTATTGYAAASMTATARIVTADIAANDMAAKAKAFKEIQRAIDELESQAAAIKEAIVMEMDGAEEATAGIFRIRHITVVSNRLDTSTFKKEHSDLYSAYLKPSTSRRFTVVV